MYEQDFIPKRDNVIDMFPNKYCGYVNFNAVSVGGVWKYSYTIVGVGKNDVRHYLSGEFSMSTDSSVFNTF